MMVVHILRSMVTHQVTSGRERPRGVIYYMDRFDARNYEIVPRTLCERY